MPALAPPHTEVRYARALTKDQAFVLDRDAMAALAFREVFQKVRDGVSSLRSSEFACSRFRRCQRGLCGSSAWCGSCRHYVRV